MVMQGLVRGTESAHRIHREKSQGLSAAFVREIEVRARQDFLHRVA